MASLEEHYKECEEKLGDPCREVNQWIDEYAGKVPDHHQWRHTADGVELARALFGVIGGEAAKFHVQRDFNGRIPRSRGDYLKGDKDKWLTSLNL